MATGVSFIIYINNNSKKITMMILQSSPKWVNILLWNVLIAGMPKNQATITATCTKIFCWTRCTCESIQMTRCYTRNGRLKLCYDASDSSFYWNQWTDTQRNYTLTVNNIHKLGKWWSKAISLTSVNDKIKIKFHG